MSVADTSAVGHGFPDLVAGFRGRNYGLEVKDPSKPPSKRRLTEEQEAFRATWRGHWAVVETLEQAIDIVTKGLENAARG